MTGNVHKRTNSVQHNVPNSSDHLLTLFLRNLHCLHLDALVDWPDVRLASFGNQDARTRQKHVEYVLFHLFRLYDPATAADKLKPFFPPLEPLQSINLRAALYRCLNELKKNGAFSRETVVRKSMLDECSGGKFWELCLEFSTIVLQRSMSRRRTEHVRTEAEQLGTATTLSTTKRSKINVLNLAHKHALSRALGDRKGKRELFDELREALTRKEDEVRQRKARAHESGKRTEILSSEDIHVVQKEAESGWIGSTSLRDAVISGKIPAQKDDMVLAPFEDVWRQGVKADFASGLSEGGVTLREMEEKTKEQNSRLAKWRTFHQRLVASKSESIVASDEKTTPPVRFDRHKDLRVHEFPPQVSVSSQRAQSRQSHAPQYDRILNEMREELRRSATSGLRHATSPNDRSGTSQPHFNARTGHKRSSTITLDISRATTAPQQRSPLRLVGPGAPDLARRVPSRSRSYQQPKVKSQREPIPLKSEIFSPLKSARRGSASPSSVNSFNTLTSELDSATKPSSTALSTQHDESTETVDSGLGSDMKPVTSTGTDSADSEDSSLPKGDENNSPEQPSQQPPEVHSEKAQPSKDRPSRLSLADRTRMSMVANGEKHPEARPSIQPLQEVHEDPDATPGADDERDSLLARTRQSISLRLLPTTTTASQPLPKPNKTDFKPRNRVAKNVLSDGPQTPSKASANRDITPIEQLMSSDAESVFRARPKIALSPVFSPYEKAEPEVDPLSMDEVEGGESSPLASVSRRQWNLPS